MEPSTPWSDSDSWTPAPWLDAHLLPDGRFARAYNALADQSRALIKSLIARHYALNPPRIHARTERTEHFDLVLCQRQEAPVPLTLLLTAEGFDAPAFFLAALMPILCARVPQVLVARLGKRGAVPDSLLVACELAGQERVAALGPLLLQRLLLEAASSGEAGVVLHPDTPEFRRILRQGAVQAALDASPLRLVPLRLPRACGLWRDTAQQFSFEDLGLLYGGLPFEAAGIVPGSKGRGLPDELAWKTFRVGQRDMLLVPDARAGQGNAAVTVSEGCLGQWRWPQVGPELFAQERLQFSVAP